MARTPNTFRLQGKSIFLTYPKCPLIPLFVIDYLFHLLNDFKITYARVCQETHQDGELHLHCLVQLDEKFSTRNPRFFDITDPNRESTYHPNAQIPRRDADVADYIAKGGVFEERGLLRASRRSPKKSRDTIWGKIIDESTNAEEFLGRCQREQPYTYATQLRNLEYMANKKWPKPSANFTPKFSIFNGVPEPIKNWVEQNICVDPENKPDRPLTLIVEGPTRTGKTAWARSLGLHNYFCGGVNWTEYNPHAIYNVFDDIPFQYLPCKKEILGAQKDFTVNEKYRKKCTIKGGIPSIILCNPDSSYKEAISRSDLYVWCQSNVLYEFIDGSIF
uniref:Replication-associated protein n=1 Tax=Tomato apical leaf curl virus TaxID=2060142 RepID=A0A7G7NB26_9GEMI|nr:putative Rep [Tomato apical leaf curl virus]